MLRRSGRGLLGCAAWIHRRGTGRLGRQGEEAVAARLARLPSEWRVLHAIEVGASGSDIDHLVIGPGGVYTVNSKHHPDAAVWVGGDCFMVDGHRQPYIRTAVHEAARAARILSKHAGFQFPSSD